MFGDLGTSPLYTLSTVVSAAGGKFSVESALGVLSLIVWTLIVTVSIKYCLLVMQADNRGEGGILALMSLVGANRLDGSKVAAVLTGMGLLGAALIYGDGVITPAISVLSALEGVNVATPLSNLTSCQRRLLFWSPCLRRKGLELLKSVRPSAQSWSFGF